MIENQDESDMSIRMRDIGHKLLLDAGDHSSRVLPIRKLNDNTFLIEFELPFTLVPDSLVKIVHQSMNGINFSSNYVVSVLNCATSEVVYGFEIFENKENNLVPCLGRSLPKECYEINITFNEKRVTLSQYQYPIASFIVCIFLSFLMFRKSNKKEVLKRAKTQESNFIKLGELKFLFDKQLLKIGKDTIELTTKENQVLKILASKLNETLSRDQLQKEVWEDEGVLVGRSLDVFISKLRKKLKVYPDIRIVNIHGKGYKLDIS